jgi:hypothetical protein
MSGLCKETSLLKAKLYRSRQRHRSNFIYSNSNNVVRGK